MQVSASLPAGAKARARVYSIFPIFRYNRFKPDGARRDLSVAVKSTLTKQRFFYSYTPNFSPIVLPSLPFARYCSSIVPPSSFSHKGSGCCVVVAGEKVERNDEHSTPQTTDAFRSAGECVKRAFKLFPAELSSSSSRNESCIPAQHGFVPRTPF